MAFYDDDDEDQQDPNAEAPVQTSGQSAVIDGQGAAPSQAAQSQAASTPDKSGNFVGIKQYLDANKNQAAKLGDQVSGKIQDTVQGAQGEIGGLGSAFEKKANEGQISDIGNAVSQGQAVVGKAASQKVGQGPTDQEKSRFNEAANAQYKGPNSLVDTDLYQPTAAKVQSAQNYANLSKDEAGSQQLLKDLSNNKPTYSAGENRLDSYLLKGSDNKQKLAAARQGADALTGSLTNAETAASAYAAQQKTLADQVRAALQKSLVNTQTQRNTDVQAELDGISKDWQSEYDSYLNLLKNSNGGRSLNLTDEQAAKLGVGNGQRIYNILNSAQGNTPEQYLTMQAFDPNKVISRDEQAQLAALDDLASGFGGALQNKYTQADLAGTLDKAHALDASRFGQAAQTAEENFLNAATGATMSSSGNGSWNQNVDDTAHLGQYMPGVKEIPHSSTINATGSVADYLKRGAPAITQNGEVSNQLADETKKKWTDQILNYLREAGYENTIASGAPATEYRK